MLIWLNIHPYADVVVPNLPDDELLSKVRNKRRQQLWIILYTHSHKARMVVFFRYLFTTFACSWIGQKKSTWLNWVSAFWSLMRAAVSRIFMVQRLEKKQNTMFLVYLMMGILLKEFHGQVHESRQKLEGGHGSSELCQQWLLEPAEHLNTTV